MTWNSNFSKLIRCSLVIQFEFMFKNKYPWRPLGKINLLNTGIQIESPIIANEMINYWDPGSWEWFKGGLGGGGVLEDGISFVKRLPVADQLLASIYNPFSFPLIIYLYFVGTSIQFWIVNHTDEWHNYWPSLTCKIHFSALDKYKLSHCYLFWNYNTHRLIPSTRWKIKINKKSKW